MISADIHLSGRLARALDALENANGKILTPDQLEVAIYPPPADVPERFQISLKVSVCEIRKKMAKAGVSQSIETIWGRGYRLVEG